MAATPSFDDLDLIAHADGRLDHDPALRSRIEAAARSDPGLQARLDAYARQTEALRRHYGARLHEPVPTRLTRMLEGSPPRHARRRFIAAAACASIMLAAAAASFGWYAGRSSGWSDRQAEPSIDLSYVDYVQTGGEAAPEIVQARIEPLDWLSDRVSLVIEAPDLHEAGFALNRTEQVAMGGTTMIRLSYGAADGRSFSLFLHPRWEPEVPELHAARKDEVSIVHWHDGSLAAVLLSEMPEQETMAIAQRVSEAMTRQDAPQPSLAPAPAATTQDAQLDGTLIEGTTQPLLP